MKKAYLFITLLSLFLLVGCNLPTVEEPNDSIKSIELTYSPTIVLNGEIENYFIQYKITYKTGYVEHVDFSTNHLPVSEKQKLDSFGKVSLSYSYQGFPITLNYIPSPSLEKRRMGLYIFGHHTISISIDV